MMIETEKLLKENWKQEEWYDRDNDLLPLNVFNYHFVAYKKSKGDLSLEVINTYVYNHDTDNFEFTAQTVNISILDYEQQLEHIDSNAKLHLLAWILGLA